MKYLKLSIMVVGVFAFFAGCVLIEPEAPVPISPIGNSDYQIEDNKVLFIWNLVEDATSYGLQIASDEKFERNVFTNEELEDTTSLVPFVMFTDDGDYYWRVKVKVENGWSDWSDPVSFLFVSYPLVVPTPISPKGSEYHNYNDGILFTWQSASGAFEYHLQISSDDKFDNILFTDSTLDAVSCVIPTDSFQWNNTYHWRIRASGWKDWGEWSDPEHFTFGLEFDLDTTYFPFGLGYEWVYQRHEYGFDTLNTWNYYDTVAIRVTDSAWIDDILYITLDNGCVLFENPVKISVNPQVVIDKYLGMRILPIPPEYYYESEQCGEHESYHESFRISYLADTLSIISCYAEDHWPGTEADSLIATLLMGIGTLSLRDCYTETEDEITHLDAVDYKLISFTTPEGKIWQRLRRR